jgi:hypothetical protein
MFRRLLRLGRSLLEVFLRSAGTGKEGPVIELPDGSILRYRRERVRRYLSIFGQVAIKRAYYLGDDGKGVFPLDAKLNLPRLLYSYVLQQWIVLFLHKLPKLLNNTVYHCVSSCALLPCYIDYCFSGRQLDNCQPL